MLDGGAKGWACGYVPTLTRHPSVLYPRTVLPTLILVPLGQFMQPCGRKIRLKNSACASTGEAENGGTLERNEGSGLVNIDNMQLWPCLSSSGLIDKDDVQV